MLIFGAHDIGSEHPDKIDVGKQKKAISNLQEVAFGDMDSATERNVQDRGMRVGIEPLAAVGFGPEAGGHDALSEAKWEDRSDGVERDTGSQSVDGVVLQLLNCIAENKICTRDFNEGLEYYLVAHCGCVLFLKIRHRVLGMDGFHAWYVINKIFASICTFMRFISKNNERI